MCTRYTLHPLIHVPSYSIKPFNNTGPGPETICVGCLPGTTSTTQTTEGESHQHHDLLVRNCYQVER